MGSGVRRRAVGGVGDSEPIGGCVEHTKPQRQAGAITGKRDAD